MRSSQPWSFFCVIAPGLEALALQEFKAKSAVMGITSEPTMVAGGLEITLPWEQGRGLLNILKIPTRVMVRLTQVTARDFPKLYQKVATLPWTQWLSHPEPLFKIAAHQCRLMHTGRVEETLVDALKEATRRQPFSLRYQKENIAPETVYVRGVDDEWTFSLDLTGDALYKRGLSDIKGIAPMRETLAAACLRFMFQELPTEPVTLMDPMCGSGTLLMEAQTHFSPAEREFSYHKSILNLGVASWKPKATLESWPIKNLVGSDLNAELINKLPQNSGIHFKLQDALELTPSESPLWIISNPPYGERIGLKGGIKDFAQKLSHSLGQSGAEKVLLVIPEDWPKLEIKGLKLKAKLPFSNGGIRVEARLWVKA